MNLAKQKGRIEEHRWDEIYGLQRDDSTVGAILLAMKRNDRPSLNRVYGMEPSEIFAIRSSHWQQNPTITDIIIGVSTIWKHDS